MRPLHVHGWADVALVHLIWPLWLGPPAALQVPQVEVPPWYHGSMVPVGCSPETIWTGNQAAADGLKKLGWNGQSPVFVPGKG